MDAVCEECGDVGFRDLLLHCSNCKNASRHRYCLDAVIFESTVEWLCSDCLPKHNEAIKSLEDASNQRLLRDTQVGSSITNESNMKEKKVTKGLWSWGHHKNRSRGGRKDRSDASTKNFLNGNTFNWGHRVNMLHKAGSDSNDASTKQFRSGDTLNSCEMFSGEMSEQNYSEKKGEDRNGRLICALGNVDGPSHSALDHASETEEHNHFLDPMGKPTLNSVECPDLLKEKDRCFSSSEYVEGSIPQGRKGDIFSLVNVVELSHPTIADKARPTLASMEQTDGCSPTLASMEKSHPPKAVKGLAYKQRSILTSKFPPKHLKPMQGSDLKTGNAEVLNPSTECFYSWSKVAEPSSPSNEREDTVEKEGAERTKCVADEELVIRTMENHTGSNLSMAKDCLVYNEGYSDETNRILHGPLLSTKDKKIGREINGEVYHICDDPSERCNSCKENETSNLKSAEGDQDGRNLKYNVGRTSSSAGKKEGGRHVLQVESINRESLSSKYVSPCESIKVNPRKRYNQSNSYTPHQTEYQKTELIKNKNVYDARSKSGPAASLKDNQIMPRKNNGSNAKAIESSRLGGHKKKDRSWLLNKAKSDLQKRRLVTSVLLPSSLHGSSVHKSIPCSKNMDCPLNNRRSSCARRVSKVDQMEPSRRSGHTNLGDFLEVPSKKKEVHSANDVEPKKRKRCVLSYDECEDADAMQVEDLNPRSCDSNGRLKKQRRCMENGVKNQRRYVEKSKELLRMGNLNRRSSKNHKQVREQRSIDANEDQNGQVKKQSRYMEFGVKNQRKCVGKSEKASRPGNMSRQSSKNHGQVKKQRSIEAYQDQNAVVGYLNAGCAKNDVSELALQTAVAEDECGLSKMPLISENIFVQPFDEPYWTGIMKIGRDYIPLAAHLSNKAGKKVQELSRSLPPIMKVTELSTLQALPKRLEAPKPRADSIGLYIFSGDTRPNKELDQLVKHVADRGIVLETVVGLAKLLLFPSVVLPEEHQTFQGKHYLWGLFECRKDEKEKLAPVEQDCTTHVMAEEQVQEQHVYDQQDKPQRGTLTQEMPLVNQAVYSENQPLLDANRDEGKEALSGSGPFSADMKAQVSANINPADHGQPFSNSEALPLKLCGFVVSRTPRSAQLIQEMQKEGALVFAVQPVLTGPVSMV